MSSSGRSSKSTSGDFFIPDTSPIFTWGPCVNCQVPGAWVSAYSPKGDGFDQTLHKTEGFRGTVGFNISATNLHFSTVADGSMGCIAQYQINGSSWNDVCIEGGRGPSPGLTGLPKGLHQIVIRAKTDETFQFYGIGGTDNTAPDGYHNVTIDNTSPQMSFSEGWSFLSNKGNGGVVNATAANAYPTFDGFYNNSIALNTAVGGSMNFTFSGPSVSLYGMSGPQGGKAEVYLDGKLRNSLDLFNAWNAYGSLLFTATGLDMAANHTVSIVNTDPGKHLVIDYALTSKIGSAPTSSSSMPANLPVILGSVAGAVVGLLVLAVLLYIRLSRKSSNRTPYGFANGLSHKDSISRGSVDTWRKQQLDSSTSTPYTGETLKSPVGSPMPESPDYIPYNGPITRSPSTTKKSQLSPAVLTGSTMSAAGWLNRSNTTTSSNTYLSRSDSMARATRNIPRKPPPPLIRDPTNERFVDIALEPYTGTSNDYIRELYRDGSAKDMIGSATPSSHSSVENMSAKLVTVQASGERSVARLWPTRNAVPSNLVTSVAFPPLENGTMDSTLQASSSIRTTPSQTPLTNTPWSSSPPSLNPFSASSQRPLLGIDTSPSQTHQSYGHSRTPSVTASGASTPLRRGVSIKSVKTMRSFISGLMTASSGSNQHNIPPTPSLPSQSAARPDSGIFPIQLSGSAAASRAQFASGSLDRRERDSESGLSGSGSRIKAAPEPLKMGERDSSPNMFIELNPYSPMTVRPDSTLTDWRARMGRI